MSHEISIVPVNQLKLPLSTPGEHQLIVQPLLSPATIKKVNKKKWVTIKRQNRLKKKQKEWFRNMRGWIMIVAVQVAAATYASGLSPPGGFWQDDRDGHIAGYAILHDKSKPRYTTFYYANASAFMASLVIIVLLMNEKFYLKRSKVVVLNVFVVLGLISLIISYAAGSVRMLSTSIFVIVLPVGVFLLVIYSAHILKYFGTLITKWCPFMVNAACPAFVDMLAGHHQHKRSKIGKDKHSQDSVLV